MAECNFFWGSHGCDLSADGHRVHQCGRDVPTSEQLELIASGDLDPRFIGPCCQYDEDAPANCRVRWAEQSSDGAIVWAEWREYGEGWRQ